MHKSGGGKSRKPRSQLAKRLGRLRRSEKVLWVSAAVTAGLILSALVRSGPEKQAPQGPTASRPPVTREAKVVDAPPAHAEELPPEPAAPPQLWKVLFASPKAGKTDVSRRADIKLFFNAPVAPDVVEWAFTLSPATPGTFSWPRHDQLVFTPTSGLEAGTQYTVSLTPTSGLRDRQEYEILETRWSFTTGSSRSYHEDIQPLIGAYCAQCHQPQGAAAEIPLETYGDVSQYVVPGRSDESPLYTHIQARQHHINMAGPAHSTSQKLAVIKDWIDEDEAAQ